MLKMTWLSLAFRNLLRNARRSATTIAAVALGYAAVNIFGGFASYMFASIRVAHIHEQGNGHVQIWKKGARQYGGSDPGAYLLSAAEFQEIREFAEKDSRVTITAGMLEVKGNLDYDGIPAFFLARAMKPSELSAMQEGSRYMQDRDGSGHFEGEPLTDDAPASIGVAGGLAENLKLQIGADVVLMAPTVQGQMNAIDAHVAQIVSTNAEVLNNRYLYLPLELAQALYDTDGVSCARILLHDRAQTDAFTADLSRHFQDREWEVIPWDKFSDLYARTKRMFDIIFGLVFAIIITIVTMSVLNTIGMAVVERTREIGTLRALGLKRPGVIRLFGIESALLGLIGAVIGLILTVTFSLAIDAIEPLWEPPVTSNPVVLQIFLVPPVLIASFALLVAFTFLAAILPARRAAWNGIVDSLGHV